jgi:hypothetical protein
VWYQGRQVLRQESIQAARTGDGLRSHGESQKTSRQQQTAVKNPPNHLSLAKPESSVCQRCAQLVTLCDYSQQLSLTSAGLQCLHQSEACCAHGLPL